MNAYTVGFPSYSDIDETYLAKKIANKYCEDINIINISEEYFKNELDAIVKSLDEPYAGGIPSWFVYKEMSKSYKVGLCGVGGDELFGNYGKWKSFNHFYQKMRHLAVGIKRGESFTSIYKNVDFYQYRPIIFFPNELTEFTTLTNAETILNKFKVLFNVNAHNMTTKDKVGRYDLTNQLTNEFLFMTDRFSMMHSLEIRTPFLDNELVDYVMSRDSDSKSNYRYPKKILMDIALKYLPNEIVWGKKKGFVVPYNEWLRNSFRSDLIRYSNANFIHEQGIFRYDIVCNYIKNFLDGDDRFAARIWTWFMFQNWYVKVYLDKRECPNNQ